MFGLLFFVFALSNLCNFCLVASDKCDIRIGPAGQFGCVQLDGYQGKQYANCLSNAYIKQKSRGKHICEDRSADYCWYQCMMENHSERYGPIFEDCKCNESLPTELLLPEKCYSPDGRDCSWYRDCLEKKHPCTGQRAGYAIEYGEKFCRLYGENYNLFSVKGREWIDGVRKCLQVAMVPIIRPYYEGNCGNIKRKAFDSHAPCYVNPGFGAPSICDLGCRDWLNAFWTIKSVFLTSDAFSTLTGMIKVVSKCPGKIFSCPLDGIVTAVEYGKMASLRLLLRSITPNRQKRDAELTDQVDRHELAAEITDTVAKQLKWNHDQLDWFGYTLENIEANGNVSVDIWLISKNKNAADDLVGNEIKRFEDLITSGNNYLNVKVKGVEFRPVTLSSCKTTNCKSFSSTVTAAPSNNANKMSTLASICIIIISICLTLEHIF